MSSNYLQMVAVPSPDSINSGLSPCHQKTCIDIFGRPGNFTRECSQVTNKELARNIVTRDVGPFRATGHKVALDRLALIFVDVKAEKPELYDLVKTEGMLCCRAVRNSHSSFSNHSWGLAIDVRVGQLIQYGSKVCQQGLVDLYHYFHMHEWYWGAEFPTCDPMHFEMSDELVNKVFRA